MANRFAFTTFEATVISVYDAGVLTLPLLDKLGLVYSGVDIEPGGRDLHTHDGKRVTQVCVELLSPGFRPGPPREPRDAWDDPWRDEFDRIAYPRWGWA